VELAGELGGDFARRLDLELQDGAQVLPRRTEVDQTCSCDRLPEHDAGGVDVRPRGDLRSEQLLWPQVSDLSLHGSVLGRMHASGRLRDTEVRDLRNALKGHEDVLRRDITVDDVERLAVFVSCLVRCVKSIEHRGDDPDADPEW